MWLGYNGGSRAILELANELTNLGHEVNVIYPKYLLPQPSHYNWKKDGHLIFASRCLTNLKSLVGIDNNKMIIKPKCNILKVPTLSAKHIPDADICIATWWETEPIVAKYPERKGKKVYFIQHYETWGGNKKKIIKTYTDISMSHIYNSSWTMNQMPFITDFNNWDNRMCNMKISKVILHAPDHNIFYYKEGMRKNDGVVRILAVNGNQSWKRTYWVINAIGALKEQYHDKIQFTLASVDTKWTDEDLCNAYNSHDIFLQASESEGFGMMPFEASCCKCAVVSTKVGAIDYFGDYVLTSDPDSFYDFVHNIKVLIEDAHLRKVNAEVAYDKVMKLTWENSAKEFEEVLIRCNGTTE